MSQPGPGPKLALYGLFTLSGFAGLIYESIWSHYLKMLLGHAAYAQTLVLVIFLGGMALGAWLAAGLSQRLARPLLAYVVVEILLGVAGFLFDPTFRLAQVWVFDALIPQLSSPLAADVLRWGTGALLMLPQSMLLGATFPLICAGLIRLYPALPGTALGWLYFSNSLGAAVGVLTSGFVLIAKVGLPGTILTAALLNLGVGLVVYLLQRLPSVWNAGLQPLAQHPVAAGGAGLGVLLGVAALTGAASFFYEIGWIRMLSLVLGSATHSFELMLSAFIFGLALGSLFIRNRIDQARDPVEWLGWIQIAMAVFAVLSLPLYMTSFELMAKVVAALKPTDTGYVMFNLVSHSICFLLMLPATFCAGMTLPLITAILLRAGHGEMAIGRVYAANTFGSIVGTLMAVHVVMPLFGLKQVIATGAALDLLLGLAILWRARALLVPLRGTLAGAGVLVALVAALTTSFDPAVIASGVYRHGFARIDGQVIFYQDGKTATVSASQDSDGLISIATNGKIDAGLNLGGKLPGMDEYTTVLLAMVPLAHNPAARSAAVIGMGSGLTTDTLLRNPRLERVDTIEIEPAMIEGARHFGSGVARTFADPRSHIRIEDAKAWFARGQHKYDLIVSEPSNPWVSGIATLFSREFYQRTRRHLQPGGLFVQWMHLYEIDAPLVATVFNAIGESFADYAVYVTNGYDILIVASPDRPLAPASGAVFESAEFEYWRERLSIPTIGDLAVRRLGSKQTLLPFFASLGMPTNSDYFPVLDQRASRARFLNASAQPILDLHRLALRLEGQPAQAGTAMRPAPQLQPVPDFAVWAPILSRRLLARDASDFPAGPDVNGKMALLLAQLGNSESCVPAQRARLWLPALRTFVADFSAYVPEALALAVAARLQGGPCAASMTSVERGWIGLLRSIGTSDWEATRTLVPALLASGAQDLPTASFLIGELLLADLKAEGPEAAARRIQKMKQLPDTLPVRYLGANIAAMLQVARAAPVERQ